MRIENRDGKNSCLTPQDSVVALSARSVQNFSSGLFPGLAESSRRLCPADQAIVPAEIVIQQEVKGRSLARPQRLDRSLLDLGLKAAPPSVSFNGGPSA